MRQSALATIALLPLMALPALALPAAAVETTRDLTVEQSSAASAAITQAGTLKVSIQTDRADATYAKGEAIRLFVTANEDAYVSVFDIGPGGQVTQLFPNAYQSDNHLLAGHPVEIAGGNTGANITVSGPAGRELVKVIASDKPLTVIPDNALQGRSFFKELQGGVPVLVRNLEVAANNAPQTTRKLLTANFILRTLETRAATGSPAFIVIPTAAPPAQVPPAPAVAPVPSATALLPVVTPQAALAPAQAFPLLVATDKQSYKIGETVTLAVTSLQACYLTVLDINAAGEARQLFPNKIVTNNAVAAYQTALISGGTSPVSLKLEGPVGTEQIIAVCSAEPKPLFNLAPTETANFAIAGDRAQVTKTLAVTSNEPKTASANATVTFTVTP